MDAALPAVRMRAATPRVDLPLRGGDLRTETGSALPDHLRPQGPLRGAAERLAATHQGTLEFEACPAAVSVTIYRMAPDPEDNESSITDEYGFAKRAIEEALKSPGNTRVGAVITRGNTILATGYKGEIDGEHAEQVALRKAREAGIDLARASLYTTLEPCANSRTASRIPCATLIADAGITVVHIGQYDPNPQVNRLGWKYLRDNGVRLRDFPADLRKQAHSASEDFTKVFTRGTGMSAGAKFDYTTNGGLFTISVDEQADAPSWETKWANCGASAIYMYGGIPGVVALARYAKEFGDIDDPDALDYESYSPRIPVGSIGVMRNEHGHVLCKVTKIEPPPEYGGTGHVSVSIKWEIRLAEADPTK